MLKRFLHAKIHRARVTHAELHYEGSIAIDQNLLDAAGIMPYEQVDIYNINNGERFSTYVIEAERGSGIISINGAAAHKAAPDHLVIICAYTILDRAQMLSHKPRLVYVDIDNNIIDRREEIPLQKQA